MSEFERDLGRLEGAMTALADRQEKMDIKLDRLLANQESARGSWQTLAKLGAACAAIAGIMAEIVHRFNSS